MKKLWICLAFLAIFGNLAFAYYDETVEDENWYDDWYEDNFGSSEESKDVNNSTSVEDLPDDETFKTTESDNNFQDYQFEDNRSEISEESLYIAHDKKNASTENNAGSENKIGYLTSTEVDNVGIDINNLDFEKKIFEDTNTILNEESGNDFTEDDTIDLDKDNTSYLNKIIDETGRLLNETNDALDEDIKINDQIDDKPDNQETTKKNTVEKAYTDLMTDLSKLKETWNKLNDFGEYVDKDTNQTSSDVISSGNLFGDDSSLEVETEAITPILYVNDALPASETEETDAQEGKTIATTTESTFTEQELFSNDASVNMQTVNRNLLLSEPSTIANEVTASDEASSTTTTTTTTPDINTQIQYIRLEVDHTNVITSKGYPEPYPSNKTTDWMFTGHGMGIELNITDLAINGDLGDYLLFKPGGVDESGSSGLIFSFTLNEERRYRFLDVDKMFVRFEAKPGVQTLRGFSFSVRMVVPRPDIVIPEPEPEPILPPPPASITLNLGGVSLESFTQIEEEFRQIIAGMAEKYIINNTIDPGINSTFETTQMLGMALCFHNWPKFETCTEVTFGVPLIYDDDKVREDRLNKTDLTLMWEKYSQEGEFAEQLRDLGITEFQVPNDRGILIVWLVIAGGVVISMAMLAFALWRYSCFEDYTRMPKFSDTESIKEKRNLDLFPTPHQTLPPLFSETDYKWADAKYDEFAQVDVGGYANRSYSRDDAFDLDSDEEIVPASARNTSFSPRDIYSV